MYSQRMTQHWFAICHPSNKDMWVVHTLGEQRWMWELQLLLSHSLVPDIARRYEYIQPPAECCNLAYHRNNARCANATDSGIPLSARALCLWTWTLVLFTGLHGWERRHSWVHWPHPMSTRWRRHSRPAMLEQRWLCTETRVGSWVSPAARWAPTLLPSPTRVDLATALDHRRVACSGSPLGMLPQRHAEVPHACLTLSRHELPARLMRPRAACYGNRR